MTLTDDEPHRFQIFYGDDRATQLSGSVRAGPADESPSETRCRLRPDGPTTAPEAAAFRIVPLVRVVGEKSARLVLVGEWRIAVSRQQATLEVHDLRVWSEESNWAQKAKVDAAAVVGMLLASPLFVRHSGIFADAQSLAAVVCKASAEASRNAVKDLRSLRYDLEAQLSGALEAQLSGALKDTKQDWDQKDVARLARVGTAVGQARDAGRAAVREGFWLYLDDDDAFHAYRKAADPSLLTDTPPATAATRPWMRSHDAGVRQCRALEEELTEEAGAVAGILDAATAVALSREAQAQDEFNRWAGVAALGLGLPSVVMAYLGAGEFLPLDPFGATLVPIIPVFAALVMAFVLTRDRLPAGTRRPAWMFLGVIALLILVTGLAAGVAKTEATPTGTGATTGIHVPTGRQRCEQTPPSPGSPRRPG